MDGVRAGAARRVEDRIDIQITLGGRGGANPHGGVRRANVRRRSVGIGERRHRFDAQFTAGADDPQRDFAAVCDQETADRCHECQDGLRFSRKARMPS